MKIQSLLTFAFFLSLGTALHGQETAQIETESMISHEESITEAISEEEPKGFSISGSADVYFRRNLTNDVDATPGTSFANLPGFSLGMANVILSHEGKKVGVTADLVIGPRGEDATFLSPFLRPGGNSSLVNQLYVYWNASDKVKVTIGNFNTFLGYEVISPVDNFNYSTSYMFSYGPFSHTGLKVDMSITDKFSVMAGLFNPTDATEFNPVNKYVGGVQFGYENDVIGGWLNFLFDDEYFQVDLTGGVNLSDNFYVGLNATSANDNFYGVALYAQVAAFKSVQIGTRLEYFSDQGVGVFDLKENVIDVTLSGNIKAGNLTIIPEFRLDLFSTDLIPDGVEMNDSLSAFVLAAVYGF